MHFVIVKKNEKAVPSDQQLTQAMTRSGGQMPTVRACSGGKRVDYTGDVAHSVFVNNLRQVADGQSASWEFVWADSDGVGALVPAPAGELGRLGAHAGNGARYGYHALGATQYGINITMTPETVNALIQGNYSLYGFKAVQATQGGGAPLVWFQIPNTGYSTLTQLMWTVHYQAYTSTSQVISGGQVRASFTADIDLGQTLNVSAGGIGDVTDGGPPRAISILNTATPFTCGISQQAADGSDNPVCAFPLSGQRLDVIAPIEKVLLMFSTMPVNTGTVIEQASSPGILIDLTSANVRNVNYDINLGWTWGGYNWASSVPANENLVPLLIEPSAAHMGGIVEPRALVLS